jgi:hypothetical protein
MRARTPSMQSLMDDPTFRSYMKRIPVLPRNLSVGKPWQLWLRTDEGKWMTQTYPSYRDVWPKFVAALRREDMDPTITSRRVFYAPPGEWYDQKVRVPRRVTPDNPKTSKVIVERRWRQTFFWDIGLAWCGRCRRPVYWQPLHAQHHATKRNPAFATEDNVRCVICGIRWIAMPDISQMNKMERADA